MKFLFCNIGWMERYEGLQQNDKIRGGGSYVAEKGIGHEVCNFSACNGTLYGYVQPSGEEINITRLGARPSDRKVSGIVVVWTATRPTGGTAVIGWYKNATVYRAYQKHSRVPDCQQANGIDGFWISAKSGDGTLLSVDERTCEIPRRVKGGMGKSNVWYADIKESELIVRDVKGIISGKKPRVSKLIGRRKKQDQARKATIEREAIQICCKHFEKMGYVVVSVESNNYGWDLEATSGKAKLMIEVKGLSGKDFFAELTNNEFKNFSKEDNAYRLAVVTSALDEPELFICRFSHEQKRWVVEGKESWSLNIEERPSAWITVSQCIAKQEGN